MNRKEIWNILETKILPLVQKPGRYIGGELNEVHKDPDSVGVRIALVFPDVYELGMSNLGLKILYEIVNQCPQFYAERVFSPWIDMEGYMRKLNVPLFSLETHSSLREFDIVGFSLQYELCYTNVLNILNLSGIPLRTEDRLEGDFPLVIAGGPVVCAPEPIAPFIDVFVIGDGENVILEILELYRSCKANRREFLKKISDEISGVYVPLYGTRRKVKKRVCNRTYIPVRPIVPLIETVHDRINLEIMRGCPRSCRFCQAGIIYKPVRKHSHRELLDSAHRCIENTGHESLGLGSLSSTDFYRIDELVDSLLKEWPDRKISLSLPSMRVDSFSLNLLSRISQVKKTGITLAPEAASKKLLDIINKGYKPNDVVNVAREAYSLGYKLIKLYFMIGLPGEDYTDLDRIVDTLIQLGKMGRVNVSIATMIPKAHTPFQWQSMLSIDEINNRQRYIRGRINNRRIKLMFHEPQLSILEAVFSRGDRSLSRVIYRAWHLGAKFDQWKELFRYNIWEEAFKDCGVKMDDYLSSLDYNKPLAWDHIDVGVSKEYLIREREKAAKLELELVV